MAEASEAIDVTPAGRPVRFADWGLLLAVAAGPIAWGLQLLVNYAFASHYCYPGEARLAGLAEGWVWPLLIAVHVAALLLSAGGAAFSYGRWRRSGPRGWDRGVAVLETGRGRTPFLALWGLLTGLGFFVAIVFGFIALFLVPPCG